MPFCGEDNKVVQAYFLGVLGAIWAVMYGGYFPFIFMMWDAEADLFYDNYYLLLVDAIIGGLIAVLAGPVCLLQENKDTKRAWGLFHILFLCFDFYLLYFVFDFDYLMNCNAKWGLILYGGRIGMNMVHGLLIKLEEKLNRAQPQYESIA